jgi:hypothetical protein
MNHLNILNASEIKTFALKAGYPALHIELGNVHVVQIKIGYQDHQENFFESLNKVAGGHDYGWMPIMDGILITASDYPDE